MPTPLGRTARSSAGRTNSTRSARPGETPLGAGGALGAGQRASPGPGARTPGNQPTRARDTFERSPPQRTSWLDR